MKYPHCPGYNEDPALQAITRGGYAQAITVNERYVSRIPENLPMEQVGPLLCAGITTYSPMVALSFFF